MGNATSQTDSPASCMAGSAENPQQCFAFDVHRHLAGECWLKHQRQNHTRPKDPFEGHSTFPIEMRVAPRAVWPFPVKKRIWHGPVPEHIPWISGVLAPPDATIVPVLGRDQWWRRWCAKHGPCTETL